MFSLRGDSGRKAETGSCLPTGRSPIDSQSNRQPFAGRLYVIVLDDQDVSAMRTAHVRKSAREFVEQYMGANDMAAVIYTSGRTDAAQEFTSNKQLLLPPSTSSSDGGCAR